MLDSFRRSRRARRADDGDTSVWQPIAPLPEWLPDDGLVITDPARIGPSIYRAIFLLASNRCAWITVCTYPVRDGGTGGYRLRAAFRYTRTDVEGWNYCITRDLPALFAEHLAWPGHDLASAVEEARRVATCARLVFPDVFAWEGIPAFLYEGEGLR